MRSPFRKLAAVLLLSALLVVETGTVGAVKAAGRSESGRDDGRPLQAAFIRQHDLWMKTGDTETKLTEGEQASHPLWSSDGRLIAYRGGENAIRVYNLAANKRVDIGNGENFQWSPNASRLAYLEDGVLQVANAEAGGFENAALGVGNYSWKPDGTGFLVSTRAQLLPDGWTDIRLYEVPYVPGAGPQEAKLLAVIPSESKQFFAVMTGRMQWSADGKRVAFIAVPTASLAADGDTLCVFDLRGKKVLPIGIMLHRDDWVRWAPEGDMLAYIAGEGRNADVNIRLTVTRPPFRKFSTLTPAGYADRDPMWIDRSTIVVSRLRETGEQDGSSTGLVHPPYLARANVRTGDSAPITAPKGGFGDYYPNYVPSSRKLSWVRSNKSEAAVWVGEADGTNAKQWIAPIDLAPEYYGQWYWEEVLDLY